MVLQCLPARSLRRPLARALQREAVTLQYDFLGATSLADATRLGPIPSFVRASAASYLDGAGILRLATVDEPRFDHNAQGEPLGLLIEGPSTNLTLHSEDFGNAVWVKGGAPVITVTPNQALSPDGQLTADQLTGSLTAGNLIFSQAVALTGATAGRSFAQSLYLANNSGLAELALVITELGGAQPAATHTATITITDTMTRYINTGVIIEDDRTSITFRIQANALGDFDLYAWGAQLEEQTFPSSYIPTSSTVGMRAADALATANLSWFNSKEGKFFVEWTSGYVASQLKTIVSLDTGFNSDSRFEIAHAGPRIAFRASETVDVFSEDVNDYVTTNQTVKAAIAYAENDFVGAYDGVLTGADTLGALPTNLNVLSVGSRYSAAAAYMFGHIRQVRYLPLRLPNVELQELTQLGSPLQYVFAGASSFQNSALAGSPTPAFVRASAAVYRDSEGVLRLAAADEPAFDHNVAGEPLGLLVEGGGTNKCENESSPSALVAPTTQTAFAAATVGLVPFDPGGSALYSIEDKGADLLAAGFSGLTNGRVIVVDNSAGSSVAYITTDGVAANTEIHTISVIAWIAPGTTATVGLTPADGKTAITSLTPEWFSHTETPIDTGRRLQVAVQAGGVVYIAFGQLEEGFLQTSPIPVNGAASLRAATLATVDNPPLNLSAGTLVVEFETLESMATAFRYAWAIDDDTPSILNLFGVYYVGNTNEVIAVVRSDGVETTLSDAAGHVKGQPVRVAFSYSPNGFAMSCNGRAVVTSSGALPTELKKLRLGVNREAFVTRFLNSTLSEWRYLPRETPAAELQAMSLPT